MCTAEARGCGTRPRPLPGRARPAHLRGCFQGSLGELAEAPDDADQRVPPDADRTQGAQVPGSRDGEVLLRRGITGAAGLSGPQSVIGTAGASNPTGE